MRPRTLAALVVIGIVAIAGGWYFGTAQQPSEQRAYSEGRLLFPGLAQKLQDAARVEISHQGKTTAIVKHGDIWGLEDRGGYAVQASKLRGMLTALTELRLVEQRTADPEQFSRLGLEDPNGKTANSNLLRVLDASGKPIVALIVGHRRACGRRDMCRSRSMCAGPMTIRPGLRRAACRLMPIRSSGSNATS